MRPHRWQLNRLPCPWDSPGKNTGVGCHFLLQCLKVKRESEVAQSCPTPSNPMDCSPPGSSIHGIFQARVLEWGAIAFSVTGKQIFVTYLVHWHDKRIYVCTGGPLKGNFSVLKCLEKVLEKEFIFGLTVEELLEIYLVDKQSGATLGKVNPSANVTRLKKHNTFKKKCSGITCKDSGWEPWNEADSSSWIHTASYLLG